MISPNTISELQRVIDQDWTHACTQDKLDVVRALKVVEITIGAVGIQRWIARLSYKWDVSTPAIRGLMEDITQVHLLAKITKPAPTPANLDFPRKGWISDYLSYTLNSEAPEIFHFWVAVTVLGGIFGRNVYHPRGHGKVYPNHFVILVAPSGIAKKTSAGDIGIDLLRQVDGINILAEKITPEALINAFTRGRKADDGECRGFIYAPELGVFLGKQQYNEGLIDLITRIADNPNQWDYETKTQNIVKLTNVNATMLGCITPSALGRAIPDTAYGGGFMSRLLFITQTKTDREEADPAPRDETLRLNLISSLRDMYGKEVVFKHSPDSKEYYEQWYHELKVQANASDNDQQTGYLGRKHDHVFRLAMVLTLAQGDDPIFTSLMLRKALKIIEFTETLAPDIFTNPAEGVVGANARRVVEQLRKAGGEGCQHSQLLKKNYRYMTKNPFAACIETLIEAKVIEKIIIGGKRYYHIKKGGTS